MDEDAYFAEEARAGAPQRAAEVALEAPLLAAARELFERGPCCEAGVHNAPAERGVRVGAGAPHERSDRVRRAIDAPLEARRDAERSRRWELRFRAKERAQPFERAEGAARRRRVHRRGCRLEARRNVAVLRAWVAHTDVVARLWRHEGDECGERRPALAHRESHTRQQPLAMVTPHRDSSIPKQAADRGVHWPRHRCNDVLPETKPASNIVRMRRKVAPRTQHVHARWCQRPK